MSVGRAQSLAALKKQVEYYFGVENMCRDMYLRGRMAPAGGWVSISVVMAFNLVRPLCASAAFFAEALGDSDVVELGGCGPGGIPTLLRRRGDWAQWLLVPPVAESDAALGAPIEDARANVLVFVAPFRALRRRLRGGPVSPAALDAETLRLKAASEYGPGTECAFVQSTGDDIGRGHAFGWAVVPAGCERREAAAAALLAPLRDAGLELHRYARFHERALAERARLGPGRAHEADALFRLWAHVLVARLATGPLDQVLFGHFRALAAEDASLGASFGLRTLFSFFADVGALAASSGSAPHARDAWTSLSADFQALVVADCRAGHVLGLRLLARVAPSLVAQRLLVLSPDVAELIAALSCDDAPRPLR